MRILVLTRDLGLYGSMILCSTHQWLERFIREGWLFFFFFFCCLVWVTFLTSLLFWILKREKKKKKSEWFLNTILLFWKLIHTHFLFLSNVVEWSFVNKLQIVGPINKTKPFFFLSFFPFLPWAHRFVLLFSFLFSFSLSLNKIVFFSSLIKKKGIITANSPEV